MRILLFVLLSLAALPALAEKYVVAVVYWCEKDTPLADWNAHQLNAAKKFVIAHKGDCHTEQVGIIDEGISVEKCRWGSMLHILPDWLQKNEGRLYLSTDCEEFDTNEVAADCPWCGKREPVDTRSLKANAAP